MEGVSPYQWVDPDPFKQTLMACLEYGPQKRASVDTVIEQLLYVDRETYSRVILTLSRSAVARPLALSAGQSLERELFQKGKTNLAGEIKDDVPQWSSMDMDEGILAVRGTQLTPSSSRLVVMSLKQIVTTALESGQDVSIEVLKFVNTTANVFPPLEFATRCALLIVQSVQVIGYVLFPFLEC